MRHHDVPFLYLPSYRTTTNTVVVRGFDIKIAQFFFSVTIAAALRILLKYKPMRSLQHIRERQTKLQLR